MGYGRGKRIKNIEHVLPDINNISKAKGDRGKVLRELNGDSSGTVDDHRVSRQNL